MKNIYGLFVAAALLILSGCAGVKIPPAPPVAPPVEEAAIQPPEAQELQAGQPEQPVEGAQPPTEEAPVTAGEVTPPPAEEPPPPMSGNRAVLALLDQAQTSNAGGKYASAGASLERALRIEPRNPWLWQQLAQVRLAEGQYAQAISLARKSNSMAKGQHRVQIENWQVIGKAYVSLGDPSSAEQAFSQSADLRQQAAQALKAAAVEQAKPEAGPPVADTDPME